MADSVSELSISPLQHKSGFNQIVLNNGSIRVTVCPEAGRVMGIVNLPAGTGYVHCHESRLPGVGAMGIGDAFYACTWHGGIGDEGCWGKPTCYNGYGHSTGQDAEAVWVQMEKKALHDVWKDENYPGIYATKKVTLRRDGKSVELLDIRRNLDSARHPMLYDLMFTLVPNDTGGLHLPIWSRLQLRLADGSIVLLSREDLFADLNLRQENVTALLLTEPAAGEGLLVEFNRPLMVEMPGVSGPAVKHLILRLRSPMILSRYEVLERRLTLTPYSLDRARIDAVFAGKGRGKGLGAVRGRLTAAMNSSLANAHDAATRGMLKGLHRLGRHYLEIGGPANERLAAECAAELEQLGVKLAAGIPVHHDFFDDAFLAERKALLAKLPYDRDVKALAKKIDGSANFAHSEYSSGPLGQLAVEAICFDDIKSLRQIARVYRKTLNHNIGMRLGEVSDGTICNANWCIPLIWINEAMARAGLLSDDDLARTYEILWLNGRTIEQYGVGVQGNWGTMERTFLAYLAVVFPGASKATLWAQKAMECLDQTILGDCSPDGGWPEPPGYAHWAMLKGLELMELLTRSGALKDDLAHRDAGLRRMMEYQWRLMKPNDLLPAVGDGWYVFRGDIYNRFARRYQMKELAAACLRHGWKPQGDDLLFSGAMPDVDAQGQEPARHGNDLLRHDGYALFRHDDTQLSLFFGYQMGHGHTDTLSWQFYAHGREFVDENVAMAKIGGTGYGSRFNALWTRASRGHSMLLVDDKDYTAQTPGECLEWDGAAGKAHGVFRATASPGVTVTREVRQSGRDYDMVDTIEGGGELGQWHTWRALLPKDVELKRAGPDVIASAPQGSIRFDLSRLDAQVEVAIEQAPPADVGPMEEIVEHGKMLLLRRKIGPLGKSVFNVGVRVV